MKDQRTLLIARCLAAATLSLALSSAAQAAPDGESWLRALQQRWLGRGEPALEAPPSRPAEEPELHAGLSPEQRQLMREQMREQWQGAAPEDRDSYRQQRREHRQQLDAEERQRLRQEMIQTVPTGFDGRPSGPPPHPGFHRRRWE